MEGGWHWSPGSQGDLSNLEFQKAGSLLLPPQPCATSASALWGLTMTFSLSALLVGLFSSFFFLDLLVTSDISDSCLKAFTLFALQQALLSFLLFLLPQHDVGLCLDTTWMSHTFPFQTCSSSGLSCFAYTSLLLPSSRH